MRSVSGHLNLEAKKMSHRNHGMVRLDDQTQCQKCFVTLTEDNMCPNQGYICRSCFNSTRKPGRPFGACDKKKRKTRVYPKRYAEPSETDCEMLVVETFIPNKKDDLYLMANSRIPNELKVGRSMDPVPRARELARSKFSHGDSQNIPLPRFPRSDGA